MTTQDIDIIRKGVNTEMNREKKYTRVPKRGDHMCFGCSPINPSGLQMDFYSNGESVFSWLTVPEHLCGWGNLVHGGVLSTILDEVMSWSAIYILKKVIVTKSIKIEFIKPVYIKNELTAEGKVMEIKRRNEAIMEGFIYNHKKDLCARSKGTFALIKPAVAKRLRLVDEEDLKGMEPILKS